MQKRRKFGYVFQKISRRSFLKVSAVTTAMAAMGLPAFAAEDTAEENCFQT